VAALARRGALRAVEPDRQLARPSALIPSAADPLVGAQWWVAQVGADRVEPPAAPGVPVTVIDSGLDSTHPEFAGRPDLTLLNVQQVVDPDDAHGTAVASVVGAPANGLGIVGVYPQAAVRAFDAGGLTVSEVVAGIDAAIDGGRGVVNMSYGGTERDFMEEEALLVAFGTGSVLVASAGNEFDEGNPPEYPASYNHVLTVAATDREGRPAYFSNANLAVDLAAPGLEIPAAVPVALDTDGVPDGFGTLDGTSFAAPIVSGAAAWVWTARPTLDNTQLFDLLRYSARDVGEPGFDDDTGFGLLDIPAALDRAAPASDLQEPNDDVDHVVPNGLFRNGTRPLTDPGRRRADVVARLDVTEDPEDVYRVWVGAKKRVLVTVRPTRDVDVEVWAPGTPSVHVEGASRRRSLIAGSYEQGRRREQVAVANRDATGRFVLLDVYLPRRGPVDARYTITIRTVPLPRTSG
jgi:subtilisin family serine protease